MAYFFQPMERRRGYAASWILRCIERKICDFSPQLPREVLRYLSVNEILNSWTVRSGNQSSIMEMDSYQQILLLSLWRRLYSHKGASA